MGFASGFRTGLATGGERRSMMPIVQGLGSMIDRIEKRNKKGSVRFGGKIGGKSSYDKYTERKDAEAAQAEEQRRYDTQQEQLKEREAMATEQAAVQAEQAAVTEQRTAEKHASQMETESQQREKAAKLFERSEKKEKRVEAYRGFIQGIQSRNKALTEASWAALAPDQPKGQEKDWAEIETEDYIDPATGEKVMDKEGNPIKKYIVGRGKDDKKGMPAPSIEFNDDGSIAIQYPGAPEPEVHPDAKTFAENVGYHLNPEFETGSKGDKDQKKEKRQAQQDKLKLVEKKIKRLQKSWDNETYTGSEDEFAADMAALTDQEEELTTGKKRTKQKTAVAKKPSWKQVLGDDGKPHTGEEPPPDFPNARRNSKGEWWVDENEETVAQK